MREGFVPFRKERVGEEPITLFFPPEGELPEEPLLDCEVVPEGAYRLISPGHRDLVSSQFFKITTNFLPDRVFVNAEEARKADLKSGDRVRVFNQRGAAEMTLEVKNEVPSGAILIYKAPWESQAGYSPNLFTDDTLRRLTKERDSTRPSCGSRNWKRGREPVDHRPLWMAGRFVQTRLAYSPVLVSIRMMSPSLQKRGT